MDIQTVVYAALVLFVAYLVRGIAGFGSGLITPPLNLPALGRRQPLYFTFRFQQRPVFLVNSRLGLVTATSLGSTTRGRLTY